MKKNKKGYEVRLFTGMYFDNKFVDEDGVYSAHQYTIFLKGGDYIKMVETFPPEESKLRGEAKSKRKEGKFALFSEEERIAVWEAIQERMEVVRGVIQDSRNGENFIEERNFLEYTLEAIQEGYSFRESLTIGGRMVKTF